MSKQTIYGSGAQVNLTTAEGGNYPAMGGCGSSGSITLMSAPFPCSGTISNLRFYLSVAPGAGTSRTMTIMKDGSASSFLATISDSATTGNSGASTESVTAGTRISLKHSVTGSPTASTGSWSYDFTPDTTDNTILCGATYNGTITTTNFGSVSTLISGSSISTRTGTLIPASGTIKNLYFVGTAPGGSNTHIIKVTKNDSDTALTVTLTGAETTANDTSNSFTVAAGDYINIRRSGGTASDATFCACGVNYVPDNSGDFIIPVSGVNNNLPNTSTNYMEFSSSAWTTIGTTEANYQCVSNATNLIGMSVRLESSPGAGKSYTFTPRINGADDTSVQVVISDSATTGSDTGTISISNGDLVDLKITPSGTPGIPCLIWSFLASDTIVNSSSSSSSSSSRDYSNSSSSSSSRAYSESSSSSSSSSSGYITGIQFRSMGTQDYAATNWTIPKPAGLQVDDFMIAHISSTGNQDPAPTPPSGYTTQWYGYYSATGVAGYTGIFIKKADHGDVAATNFVFTPSASGYLYGGVIMAFRGVAQVNPIDVSGDKTDSTTQNIVIPTITPSAGNKMMVMCAFAGDKGTNPSSDFAGWTIANTNPTWTEAYDFSHTSVIGAHPMAGAYGLRAGGSATGNCSVTESGTWQAGSKGSAIIMALTEAQDEYSSSSSSMEYSSSSSSSAINNMVPAGYACINANGVKKYLPIYSLTYIH